MQQETPNDMAGDQPAHNRIPRWLRRELILAAILIPAGLFLLPIAIFYTGQALLGAYSDQGHGIGHLYGDIFRDMGAGFLPAWLLVLSPWIGLQLIRLSALPLRRRKMPRENVDDL